MAPRLMQSEPGVPSQQQGHEDAIEGEGAEPWLVTSHAQANGH